MSYKALDIARYVINYTIENNNAISNIMLQKIMYYIQANFLVNKNKPCFDEEIINWEYGPVIQEVYDEFKRFGRCKIQDKQEEYEKIVFDDKKMELEIKIEKYDDAIISEKDKEGIDNIIDSYTIPKYLDHPFELVEKTHREEPWKNSNRNEIISVDSIKNYYEKHIDEIQG